MNNSACDSSNISARNVALRAGLSWIVTSNIGYTCSTIAPGTGPAKSTLPRAELDKSSQFTITRSTTAGPSRNVIDPAIWHGKPVIRGFRVPMTVGISSRAGGMRFD
jgi:hypothetical protein